MDVTVRLAPGELLDRITILELKSERIPDEQGRMRAESLREEYERAAGDVLHSSQVQPHRRELKDINRRLWDAEERVRRCEREQDFGLRFIETARSIYRLNDRRAAVKKQIDEALGSDLTEGKSYGTQPTADS